MVQYFDWITGLFHGDLGESYLLHRSVASLIGDRLASTVELAVAASRPGRDPSGSDPGRARRSARRRPGSAPLIDFAQQPRSSACPSFLVGLGLILVFGIFNHLAARQRRGQCVCTTLPIGIQYLILPAVALALSPGRRRGPPGADRDAARSATRTSSISPSARGHPPARITFRHVLRNSLGTAVVAARRAVRQPARRRRGHRGDLHPQRPGPARRRRACRPRDFTALQVLILGAVLVAVVMQLCTEIGLAALDPRITPGRAPVIPSPPSTLAEAPPASARRRLNPTLARYLSAFRTPRGLIAASILGLLTLGRPARAGDLPGGYDQQGRDSLAGASLRHPFGTDEFGRDISHPQRLRPSHRPEPDLHRGARRHGRSAR